MARPLVGILAVTAGIKIPFSFAAKEKREGKGSSRLMYESGKIAFESRGKRTRRAHRLSDAYSYN